MNRWPTRPETLIARYERAIRAHAALEQSATVEEWFQAARRIELAKRDLLARIRPATEYQARRR